MQRHHSTVEDARLVRSLVSEFDDLGSGPVGRVDQTGPINLGMHICLPARCGIFSGDSTLGEVFNTPSQLKQ